MVRPPDVGLQAMYDAILAFIDGECGTVIDANVRGFDFVANAIFPEVLCGVLGCEMYVIEWCNIFFFLFAKSM